MDTRVQRAPQSAIDSAQFRKAMGQFATGVTVITTRLADGSFRGLTASSFNSVSLDPPLILWSLANGANSMPIFNANSHYVVNVLNADHGEVARLFSTRGSDPFTQVQFHLSRTGQPILNGAVAWFECSNRSRYPEGDHVIFVGEVEACACAPTSPLIYHGGQFHHLKSA